MHQNRGARRLLATSRRRRLKFAAVLLLGPAAVGLSGPAEAMVINANYNSSVNSAPAGFKTAFQSVVNYFDNMFSDPITVNIGVG